MCYSLWCNIPRMLPAGSLEAPLPGYQQATSWVYYTTNCNTQSSAPEDRRHHRPKRVELVGIINKPLLLHLVGIVRSRTKATEFSFSLVGVYIIYINDARSNKYQRQCRMDLQEVGCGYGDWIGLAQDRDGWRKLVNAVMNLRVP